MSKLYLKFFLLVFALFITVLSGRADNYNFYGGARSAGMSNSVIMSPQFSYMQNQASLGWTESSAISFYSYLTPQLPQLSVIGTQYRFSALGGGFGIQLQRFGYEAYNENKLGLGYGKKLGENFSAGVQFNYLYTDLSGPYKSYHCFVVEAGVQAQIDNHWLFGAHVFNPTLSKMGDNKKEPSETVLRIGAGIKVTETFLLTLEAEKHLSKSINIRMGTNFEFDMGLSVQAGFQTKPRKFSMGVGYKFKRFAVQVAATSNTYLKPGMHLGLQYFF